MAQAKAQLTSTLANYEKTRKEMKSFRISFTRTVDDQAFRTRTVVKGEAAGAGADLLRVDCKGVENTTILYTGKEIVIYDYESKTKRVLTSVHRLNDHPRMDSLQVYSRALSMGLTISAYFSQVCRLRI
jgi:outer membrane lipoprotein-sorting protein